MCDSIKIRLISRRTKFFCSVIIIVILINMVDLSQAQTEVGLTKVVVSNRDGKGVQSLVIRQYPDGNQESINKTDMDGTLILKPPENLSRSDKVCVKASALYYRIPECQEVQEQMSFTVNVRNTEEYYISKIGNLITIASMSDLTINAGEKALVSSEIANRVHKLDSKFANEARYFAYWSAGEALGIDDAVTYDFIQKNYVPSHHLKESITLFQRSNNINDTGRLDEPTMSLMAGQSLWMYLYDTSPAWGIIKRSPPDILENEHWTKLGYYSSNTPRIQPAIPNDLIATLARYDNDKLVNLGLHATEAKQEGKFALAAMLNSEITTRLRQLNTAEANLIALGTEIETYKALGMELDLSSNPVSFDVLQNKYVMSQALSDELRLFQIRNGVTVTGISDYRTLRTLANDNVGQYLNSQPW